MTDPTIPITASFDDLYRTEYPGLIGVAIALTGTIEDGEDVVQGTMLKAVTRWDTVRGLDRPLEEIARILNAPEGTVRSDLTRARAALRAELEDWR